MQPGSYSEYLVFMEWLQATHPDLYMAAWKSISPPADGEAVTIIKDGLDEQIYKGLIDAKFEYYKKQSI